jgi:hypothetical protein
MFRSLAFIGVIDLRDIGSSAPSPAASCRRRTGLLSWSTPSCLTPRRRADGRRHEGRENPGGERGDEGFNTISGYSLLTSAHSSNMGFSSCSSSRGRIAIALRHARVVSALNRVRARHPEGGVCVRAAGDSGARRRRRLHDAAAGSRRPACTPPARRRFLEAARKRPEIGRINTLYRASVPQVYADIDRARCSSPACCSTTSTPRSGRCPVLLP